MLKFSADGSVSGNFTIERSGPAMQVFFEEGQVTGRWWVKGGALCVEGRGFPAEGRNCYGLTRTGSTGGGEQYAATSLSGTGQWQLVVHRAAGAGAAKVPAVPAAPAAAPAASPSLDAASKARLARLDQIYAKGLITKEEYEAKRGKLLATAGGAPGQ